MNKKIIVFALSAVFLAVNFPSEAQQPTKIPRIGWLTASSLSAQSARIEAFRQGLRDLGYLERKNIVIELRFGEGKLNRLPALVAELVRLKVDIIVSAGPAVTRPAKAATSTIPIVMTNEDDPVETGFVASLARPGGNITGLSTLAPELSGKRLEILREVVPKLSRVAVLGTSTAPGYAQNLKEIELAAGALKAKLQYLDVLDPKDIEAAFRAASKGRAEAILVLGSPVFTSQRTQIVELALKNRLPAIYPRNDYVEEGGAHDVQHELDRLGPARRYVCRQDFERQEARRHSRRATDQVRVHRQSKNRQADRIDDSAQRAGAGGPGDSLKEATCHGRGG